MRKGIALAFLLSVGCVDRLDPAALGVYSVSAFVAEVEQDVPLQVSPTGSIKFLLTRAAFSYPFSTLAVLTDRVPPNCLGLEFDAGNLPGGNSMDGGTLTFTGFVRNPSDILLVDVRPQDPDDPVNFAAAGGAVQFVPGPDLDDQGDVRAGSGLRYTSNVPPLALFSNPMTGQPNPVATVFGDGTLVQVETTGGSQAPAFSVVELAPPPERLRPDRRFDLNAVLVGSSTITARWEPLDSETAPLVLLDITAVRGDGQGAQLICLDFMDVGRLEVPSEAIDIIPRPLTLPDGTPVPTQLITSLVGVQLSSSTPIPEIGIAGDESVRWGSYLVGVGRGSQGQTILLP